MNRIIIIMAAMLLSLGCAAATPDPVENLLPKPSSVTAGKGTYRLPATSLKVKVSGPDASALDTLLVSYGFQPVAKGKADVTIAYGDTGSEAYTLKVTSRGIEIKSEGAPGAFYGVQTLRQMLDSGLDSWPCMTISDSPRFPYRGLMFDVSRHFRTVDFIKKQIDAMARLKMNNLHLHLTDAAGWRMPVESYPKLNTLAAWRPQTKWSDWVAAGAHYATEGQPGIYGGYYTKDELRDLVDYAAARHIRIIPEIEMPGHSEEVVAAYPEISCSGTGSDLCPGKEATFTMLQAILDEVIDIFPSELIHIGGDEASKSAWHTCADCQRRMQEEGLADVDELQSYLIKRIERYVNSKGRRIVGWDEILEGGVAPDATVMSWRGVKGGHQAMAEGHDVVMTPVGYCYIDYCQDAPFTQPVSIGGYTPLRRVYSFEPADSTLSEAELSHLLGVQANLWTEQVTTDEHAEYMYYPRTYAIAEIGWSPAAKDYDDFHRRALAMNSLLDSLGYHVFDLANEYGERPESLTPVSHLALGAPVTYTTPYHAKYPAQGVSTLTDGILGGWTYGDNRWQGWLTDIDLTVDLGRVQPLHMLSTSFMHSPGAWVHLPKNVVYEVSTDGVNFEKAGEAWCDVADDYQSIMMKPYAVPVDTEARYVRLRAKANDRPGAWLFLDEIIVN